MKFHNGRIRIYLLLWAVSTALVSSCTLKVERLEQPIATVSPTATLPVPTETPTPLPTLALTATPTAQPTVDVLEACLPLEEKLPDDLNFSGIWVRNSGKPYLQTMDGRTAYGVPLRGGSIFSTSRGDLAISPDGQYLAYIDSYLDETGRRTQRRILRIINSSGHSVAMDYWITDWQWLIGWMDDQHLAILTGNKELLLLEPFTGSWEKLRQPAWLGNIDNSDYGYLMGPFFSPSLTSVLFQSGPQFELRDFRTGRTIYKREGYLYLWDFDWSADGSTLAIGVENFLHVITREQQVMEVDARQLGIDSVNYPKLSPDGRKLVFTSYWSGKLFLFDIEQLEIRELCSDEFDYWQRAVWSPDGRFVVQEADSSGNAPFDLLIDTQEMRAYKLISGRYQHRLVWLNEP